MTTPVATRPLTWTQSLYDAAITSGNGPLFLRRGDGWMLPLPVERWCAPPDDADAGILLRCRGTVLDIGCGPGRFVSALHRTGKRVLGVDVSNAAVSRTNQFGGEAVCRSIFEAIPAEGSWDTALLVDGNIGIGGDPEALLRRVWQILATTGQVLAELAFDEVDESMPVRLDDGRQRCDTEFLWARVGHEAMHRYANATGWQVAETWQHQSSRRRFARLERR